MIRVNLLKNRVSEQATVVQSSGGGSEMRDNIVKIVFLAVFTVGLMVYEGQMIRKLNDDNNRLQVRLNELEAEAAAKARETDTVRDVEKQARELEDKLKILKLLSRLRLREVKTLDFMQSSIPEKVWLRTINFESNEDQVDDGSYQFTGRAVGTEDLSEFVKRLEESAYLREVIVVKNQEVTLQGKAVVRDFTFTAEVENRQ